MSFKKFQNNINLQINKLENPHESITKRIYHLTTQYQLIVKFYFKNSVVAIFYSQFLT